MCGDNLWIIDCFHIDYPPYCMIRKYAFHSATVEFFTSSSIFPAGKYLWLGFIQPYKFSTVRHFAQRLWVEGFNLFNWYIWSTLMTFYQTIASMFPLLIYGTSIYFSLIPLNFQEVRTLSEHQYIWLIQCPSCWFSGYVYSYTISIEPACELLFLESMLCIECCIVSVT